MGAPVVVIGIDGASPDLVEQWTASGDLPNLRRLIEQGFWGKLKSTYPPISAAAWVTFMTGRNPGSHGIFDFRNYNPRSYACYDHEITTSSPFAGTTFWDVATRFGRKCGIITVPMTYPAWPLNGFLVSGFPTPTSAQVFTYPASLGEQLSGLTENNAILKFAEDKVVLEELNRITRARAKAARELLQRESYDLFVVVFGSPDRAQHNFWKYMDAESNVPADEADTNLDNAIFQVYQEVDLAIGRILEVVDRNAKVIVMSDHGARAHPTRQFNINAWLEQQGYLRTLSSSFNIGQVFKPVYRRIRQRLPFQERIYRNLPPLMKRFATRYDSASKLNLSQIDWRSTQAYRFPMHPPVEGIVLNVKGRQPHGVVLESEYDTLRGEIIAQASSAIDPENNTKLVKQAYVREELFHGPMLENAPDIILELDSGYIGGTGVAQVTEAVDEETISRLSGIHAMDGILIVSGPGVQPSPGFRKASIIDLAPTVLRVLGLPVPKSFEGRVLVDLAEETQTEEASGSFEFVPDELPVDAQDLTPEQQAEILERLRQLGYVE